MNKKILFALSAVIVALVAVGTVSAFEIPGLGSLFGSEPDQNITLDGETFHIPGTFKENLNVSKNGTVDKYYSFNTTTYERGYLNGTNYINVIIYDYEGTEPDENLINYMNGTSKNISEVKGYQYYDGVGYTFTYPVDNKVIAIQSDNEDIIAHVIA